MRLRGGRGLPGTVLIREPPSLEDVPLIAIIIFEADS